MSEYTALKESRDSMKIKLGELETAYEKTMVELDEAMKSYKSTKNLLDMRDKEISNMRLEVDKLRKQRDALASRNGGTALRRAGSDAPARRSQQNGIKKDAISPFRMNPFGLSDNKSVGHINRNLVRPAYVRRTEEDAKKERDKSNLIG